MSEFDAMRADLVRRGLLTPDFALTKAGHDHCAALIVQLQAAPPPAETVRPAVQWNCGQRFWKIAA